MLQSHIQTVLSDNLGHTPTDDQTGAIESLSSYVLQNTNESVFILKGFAGTGKTSLINALVKTLNTFKIKSVLLAPTGRAAKVLTAYTSSPAYTIHKKIYRQKSSKDGLGNFSLNYNKERETFFIVDEASMINNDSPGQSIFGSGRLLDDLVEFVYSGHDCKLILVGDTAQLPPVGSDISPALDESEVGMYGFGVKTAELKQVVRQSELSGILLNATAIREMIENDDISDPAFKTEGLKDVLRINGEMLLEEIETAYSFCGVEGTIIVVNSNKLANRYNQGIRNRILFRDEEISSGDMLMVVKNNYFWADTGEKLDFIANGDIARIKRIKGFEEMHGFRFADMILDFQDYDTELEVKVNLETLWSDTASLSADQNKSLFESVLQDYVHLKSRKKQYDAVKNDPYFNALQVKFAYAVTCHKAQGGQWERVFVDQGMFNRVPVTKDYLRWLYTSVTRATDRLYLVNFDSRFFR
jgi:exodeoxyribonuclease V